MAKSYKRNAALLFGNCKRKPLNFSFAFCDCGHLSLIVSCALSIFSLFGRCTLVKKSRKQIQSNKLCIILNWYLTCLTGINFCVRRVQLLLVYVIVCVYSSPIQWRELRQTIRFVKLSKIESGGDCCSTNIRQLTAIALQYISFSHKCSLNFVECSVFLLISFTN